MGKIEIPYVIEGIMFMIIIVLILASANPRSADSKQQPSDLTMTMVSGTEYVMGDMGQIIVELRNRTFDPISDAECNTTIQYHNKTTFVQDGQMILGSIGTFYYNFTVPDVSGVYEYSVLCVRNGKKYIIGKSFHVQDVFKAWVTP
jgi:hypothetical protein